MFRLSKIVTALSCFIVLVYIVDACELDQTHTGCRIENGACTCSFGCKSDFRYSSRQECEDALKGRSSDICSKVPCLHGGGCIQVSQAPGYKCRCEGTGYWGSRCQRQCPTAEEKSQFTVPYECIVI